MSSADILSPLIGLGYAGFLIFLNDVTKNREKFSNTHDFYENQYNNGKIFYQSQQPMKQAKGDVRNANQLLAYQLYQQAVDAATPNQYQLDSAGGQVPIDHQMFDPVPMGNMPAQYQAVNFGNPRADQISVCAQNAPTFVSTSLLPKPTVPGQDSWDIGAPQNILASQDFLSAVQQIGTDTVLGSLRNASYDIRNNIPNPINVVSPWMNTTITPDLERRPLDCFIPENGLYGCGPAGANVNGTYVQNYIQA